MRAHAECLKNALRFCTHAVLMHTCAFTRPKAYTPKCISMHERTGMLSADLGVLSAVLDHTNMTGTQTHSGPVKRRVPGQASFTVSTREGGDPQVLRHLLGDILLVRQQNV